MSNLEQYVESTTGGLWVYSEIYQCNLIAVAQTANGYQAIALLPDMNATVQTPHLSGQSDAVAEAKDGVRQWAESVEESDRANHPTF